jgi:hypothetical protein
VTAAIKLHNVVGPFYLMPSDASLVAPKEKYEISSREKRKMPFNDLR